MDITYSETHDIEQEIKRNELRQKIESYETLNRTQKARTLEDIKSTQGEEWVNNVILVVNTSHLAYQVWNLIDDEVTSQDLLVLSKLLSNEKVCCANDRSVKSYLIPKIVNFSSQEEDSSDRDSIIRELQSATLKLLDTISYAGESIDQNSSWFKELDYRDLYDIIRAQLLLGDSEIIGRITTAKKGSLSHHFVSQLDRLKGIDILEIQRIKYQTEPGIRYQDDDDEDEDPYSLDEENEETINTLKDTATQIDDDNLFSNYTREQAEEAVSLGRDRVEEIVESMARYRQVRSVLYDLDQDERESLTRSLEKIAESKSARVKLDFLEALLTHNSSDDVHLPTVLEMNQYSLNDLPELLSDDAMIQLITIMTKSIDKFKFELSMLLTQVNINLLPIEVIEKIKPITMQSEFRLMPENGTWYLCGSGETRLLNSIEDGAVVAVNGKLLVKFVGKFSAFCTETFTTKEGYTFIEGSWYSPVDLQSRFSITEAFDNGVGAIDLGSGEWAFMRAGFSDDDHTVQQIIEESRRCIKKCIAGELPREIRGMPRQLYRETSKEYF